MNYYIQGNKERAKEIKAAFEELGYDTKHYTFDNDNLLFYTINGDYIPFLDGRIMREAILINIIKTHPDYKELELPVKPKFNVGEWLVYKNGNCFAGGFSEVQVVKVKDGVYYFASGTSGSLKFIDENCRLWTIADAKDGDVLATDGFICIFKKLDKDGYYIFSPCIYTIKDGLEIISDENDTIGSCSFKPATKEDRELLFRKMREAGYEWDADKKEFRKIKSHYDIANFYAGMPVLVRDYNDEEWCYVQFSHIRKLVHALVFNAGCNDWYQCIPFEGNEALLGTTDMPSEEFINW